LVSNIISHLYQFVSQVALQSVHSNRHLSCGSLGLTGIELIGDEGTVIPLVNANLHSNAANAHLTRLIDGHNVTTEMNYMWLADLTLNKRIVITVTFDSDVYLTGLRIWNYNASLELSYCGVRTYCSNERLYWS